MKQEEIRGHIKEKSRFSQVWKVVSPFYDSRGIHLAYDSKQGLLMVQDRNAPGNIVGHTALDRYADFQTRLAKVSQFLKHYSSRPINHCIVPSSIGLEALSFARQLARKLLKPEDHRIHSLDIHPVFMACATSTRYPIEILERISEDRSWDDYYEIDGQTAVISQDLLRYVSFMQPGNILDMQDYFDSVAVFNLLYHLAFDVRFDVLQHVLEHANFIVAFDRASWNTDPDQFKGLCEEAGYSVYFHPSNRPETVNPICIRSEVAQDLILVMEAA